MRWMDSIKEAIGKSLQEQNRNVKIGYNGHLSFIGSPGVRGDSVTFNTHTIQNRAGGFPLK